MTTISPPLSGSPSLKTNNYKSGLTLKSGENLFYIPFIFPFRCSKVRQSFSRKNSSFNTPTLTFNLRLHVAIPHLIRGHHMIVVVILTVVGEFTIPVQYRSNVYLLLCVVNFVCVCLFVLLSDPTHCTFERRSTRQTLDSVRNYRSGSLVLDRVVLTKRTNLHKNIKDKGSTIWGIIS